MDSLIRAIDVQDRDTLPRRSATSATASWPASARTWSLHLGAERDRRADARTARDDGRARVDCRQRLRLVASQRLDGRRLPRAGEVDNRVVGWDVAPCHP
jgi:hypothetical protein